MKLRTSIHAPLHAPEGEGTGSGPSTPAPAPPAESAAPAAAHTVPPAPAPPGPSQAPPAPVAPTPTAPPESPPTPGDDQLKALREQLAAHEKQLGVARKKALDAALDRLQVDPAYRDLVPAFDVLDGDGEKKLEDWVSKRPRLQTSFGTPSPSAAPGPAPTHNPRTSRLTGALKA